VCGRGRERHVAHDSVNDLVDEMRGLAGISTILEPYFPESIFRCRANLRLLNPRFSDYDQFVNVPWAIMQILLRMFLVLIQGYN